MNRPSSSAPISRPPSALRRRGCPRGLAPLLLVLAASFPLPAQDPPAIQERRGPPILVDIPVLGALFQSHGERLWFELPTIEDMPAPALAGEGERSPKPPFRERWLREALLREFPVKRVEFVEESSTRRGTEETVSRSKYGVEVWASKESLPAIEAWLQRWAQALRRVVVFELQVIDVGSEPLEPVARDGRSVVMTMDEARLRSRRAALDARPEKPKIVTAPSLAVMSGQRGVLSITKQRSYIRDYRIEQVGGAQIADPMVDIVEAGLVVEVEPIVHAGGEQLTLCAAARISDLVLPMREFKTTVGQGQEVVIQLPEIRTSTWETEDLVLGPGGNCFVVTGLKVPETGEGARGIRHLELWGKVSITSRVVPTGHGEVLAVDTKGGAVFVRWPEDVVREDPMKEAPSTIEILRGGERVGSARLEGGWNLPMPPTEERWRIVAIYRLIEGSAQPDDVVR